MDEHTTPTTTLHSAPVPGPAEAAGPIGRRRRGLRTAGLATAGVLLLTFGAAGGAWGATHLGAGSDSSTAAVAGPGAGAGSGGSTSSFARGPGSFGGFPGSGASGYGPGSGSSSSSDGTIQSTATAATAAQKVGVVTITTVLGYEDGEAAGTGIILTSNGEILTNNHVVAGSTSITVTVESTGKSYTAAVVGTDATDDVAVLQLRNASGLTPATLASTAASSGQSVTAVGNAGGTGDLTTASGTVTDLDQTITTEAEGSAASETLHGLIQTDADVVAGDSGGPLVNSAGAVVGIDTAASSGTQQTESYAIPIASALTIAQEIEAGDASSTVTIGYPAFLGIEVDASQTSGGALVAQALDGTPAAEAGITAGDSITKVDGRTISDGDDLTAALRGYQPGDRVTVTVTDGQGASRTASITLIAGPAN